VVKRQAGKRRRAQQQKVRKRYAKAREDAQLLDVIPTTPEGALKPEAVDPASQSGQGFPALIITALKNGWAVPDEAKPRLVASLMEPFFTRDVVTDKDGNQIVLPPNRPLLVRSFNALVMADKVQWERDNPKLAGKAKGGSNVSVDNKVQVAVIDWYSEPRRSSSPAGAA
jgi:hypothetical protein